MPVLKAFMREMVLPGSVRELVESCGPQRLAWIRIWVAIGLR
jgi:hypothetical protein